MLMKLTPEEKTSKQKQFFKLGKLNNLRER